MHSMYVFTRRFSRSCPLFSSLPSTPPSLLSSPLPSFLVASSPLQEKVAKGNSLPPTAKHEWAPTCEDWTGSFSMGSRRRNVELGGGGWRRGWCHTLRIIATPLHLFPSLEKITKKKKKINCFPCWRKKIHDLKTLSWEEDICCQLSMTSTPCCSIGNERLKKKLQ